MSRHFTVSFVNSIVLVVFRRPRVLPRSRNDFNHCAVFSLRTTAKQQASSRFLVPQLMRWAQSWKTLGDTTPLLLKILISSTPWVCVSPVFWEGARLQYESDKRCRQIHRRLERLTIEHPPLIARNFLPRPDNHRKTGFWLEEVLFILETRYKHGITDTTSPYGKGPYLIEEGSTKISTAIERTHAAAKKLKMLSAPLIPETENVGISPLLMSPPSD